jgi:hypothetical protein
VTAERLFVQLQNTGQRLANNHINLSARNVAQEILSFKFTIPTASVIIQHPGQGT